MNNDLFSEEEIRKYINEQNIDIPVDFVLYFWRNKCWRYKNGNYVKSLDAAIRCCKGIYDKRANAIKDDKYSNLLERKEWIAFRKFIFAVQGYKCKKCGKSNCILQVHHKKYNIERMPWEYTCNDVIVLCKDCHKKVHGLK